MLLKLGVFKLTFDATLSSPGIIHRRRKQANVPRLTFAQKCSTLAGLLSGGNIIAPAMPQSSACRCRLASLTPSSMRAYSMAMVRNTGPSVYSQPSMAHKYLETKAASSELPKQKATLTAHLLMWLTLQSKLYLALDSRVPLSR